MGRHFAIPLLMLLAGCGIQVLKQGEPNFNTAILLPYPTPQYQTVASARDAVSLDLVPAALPAACLPLPAPPPGLPAPGPVAAIPPALPAATPAASSAAQRAQVTACVYAVKAIIDDLYREYRITLHHFADDGNAVADMSVLALTGAATGPVSTVAKTTLSGISTFIGGSKSILNQDLLYKQTVEILINQMDTDRDNQFKTMIKEMGGGSYSMEQAKADLLEYFAEGTWDHAVTSLQTAVASNQANCKAQTDAAKVAQSNGTANAAPTGGTTGSTTTPASSTSCSSTTTTTTLTPTVATAKTIFQATNGVTFYQVVKAAGSTSDPITVAFSTDGENFPTTLAPMPFSIFVLLVNPTPVKN
jgi:hypothetical protein